MVQRTRVIISVLVVVSSMLAIAGQSWCQDSNGSQQPEQELVIVKYGSLSVKSSDPAARVVIDGADKGGAGDIIESVVAGEHAVSCMAGGRTVSGTFAIRKNETLKLEALFDEGKLIPLREPVKPVEPEMKKTAAIVKPEKPKKTAPPEPKKPALKKAEQKNPVEERRVAHLNIMRLVYEVTDAQEVVIEHEENHNTITKLSVKKDSTGKYYRTKQGVLLCDAGPCELSWRATFQYTDETGKSDAVLLNWRQTVFNGVTPTGTSKRELECCLNGQCWKMQDTSSMDLGQEFNAGRFHINWNKTSVQMMRTDIMNEIITAGRSLADYQ